MRKQGLCGNPECAETVVYSGYQARRVENQGAQPCCSRACHARRSALAKEGQLDALLRKRQARAAPKTAPCVVCAQPIELSYMQNRKAQDGGVIVHDGACYSAYRTKLAQERRPADAPPLPCTHCHKESRPSRAAYLLHIQGLKRLWFCGDCRSQAWRYSYEDDRPVMRGGEDDSNRREFLRLYYKLQERGALPVINVYHGIVGGRMG